MFKKNLFVKSALAISITMGLSACGGSGSSSDSKTTQETEIQTGSFVDSPVQGLRYLTASKSGVTNANGEFEYLNGEEIAFYLGNSLLGRSLAGTIVTPAEMADESSGADHVNNILRFLQTMDEDGNPSNGIVISENARALAETPGVEINFNQPAIDFEQSVDPFLSTVTSTALVSAEDARNHFETTLAKNEVDIRGEWIATSVYKRNGEQLCEASATYTFTDSKIAVEGNERQTSTNDDGTVNCELVPFTFNGDYANPDLRSTPGAGCTGGICTLDQLNRTVDKWDYEERTEIWEGQLLETKLYSIVELKHTIGADTMVRIKTNKTETTNTETGQTGTGTHGISKTTFLKKEAAEYTKDMRGTWEITGTRSSCPDMTAVHTITYSDTGLTAVGEELNFENGSCVIANINESLAYDNPELPEEFCGPVCSYSELNGTYSDEGDTIKLSHKRGTNKINRTKGLDSRSIWVKFN